MSKDFVQGNDEVEDEGFIITNLGSALDLDGSFRPDDQYLARGPFKVHSPGAHRWKWGYRLEQVGKHLVFQDGSALGRTVMSDGMSMRASDDGSIIWLFGFEDDGLTVLTLSTATIEDYRLAAPDGVAVTSFEDGARVVMAELETSRRARFGLAFECVLASRLGVVFRDDPDCTLIGLYYFDHFGGIHRRASGDWFKCHFSDEGHNRIDNEDLFLAPILRSAIPVFDKLSEDEDPLPLSRLSSFIYPKFDTDDPTYWSDMFDDSEIVD